MVTRVFLIDDHEIVRQGVGNLLESTGEFVVVGEAGTAEQAHNRIVAAAPDLAIIDVRLPDGNGVEVCRDIRSLLPDLRCVMLTSFSDDEALVDAAMAGAHGFALKQLRGSEVLAVTRAVASGQVLLTPDMVKRAMARLNHQRAGGDLPPLSGQEERIFVLIGQGRSNRQIAQELFLAEKTVKNYVSNLLTKLGMSRRTEAAALAARLDERNRRRTYE